MTPSFAGFKGTRYDAATVPCIDWYHIAEKLWEAAGCLHREGSKELAAWVAEQQTRLRRGNLTELTTELNRVTPPFP
jgi:hypothetical protein